MERLCAWYTGGMPTCTRCDQRVGKCLPIIKVHAHGWWPSSSRDFPPQVESVCADCITNEELVSMLRPVVLFVLQALPRTASSTEFDRALDYVTSFFQVRSSEGAERRAALRAVGLLG